jgi:hypothetical protein
VKTTDGQVKKLMKELGKHGKVGLAAIRAGVDRKTARKYVKAGKLPSEMVMPRSWRTRSDPFEEEWPRLAEKLEQEPALEAKTLFELLLEEQPGKWAPGQLRTLQRRIQRWRAERGPEREVMFSQAHVPGEACQVDFTETASLCVTISGELVAFLLCVFALPFSNWQWATLCASESLAALRRGIQAALFQLGRVPRWCQTDNSTAATHNVMKRAPGQKETPRRPFNAEYLSLVRHFGMSARTTEIGAKEQNGDVEVSHRALKSRLEQALLIRGHREFDSRDEWESFVHGVLRKANAARGPRVQQELDALNPLSATRLPEFVERDVLVTGGSTIRVHNCAYSVPSRLIGSEVKVRLYEDRIEVYFGEAVQLSCERLRGSKRHRIDYRHVIWSLVRKPGAFARYVYREEMFPSLAFRRAYDAIRAARAGVRADLEYLRILHLAASTMESQVEIALELLLSEGRAVTADAVKAITTGAERSEVPDLEAAHVDLAAYDQLLSGVAS